MAIFRVKKLRARNREPRDRGLRAVIRCVMEPLCAERREFPAILRMEILRRKSIDEIEIGKFLRS